MKDRRKLNERIRKAISRFNKLWEEHLEKTLKDRIKEKGLLDRYNALTGQGGPLQTDSDGGKWQIKVKITSGERKDE